MVSILDVWNTMTSVVDEKGVKVLGTYEITILSISIVLFIGVFILISKIYYPKKDHNQIKYDNFDKNKYVSKISNY